MIASEEQRLTSEIAQVSQMLAKLPEDAVIDKLSLKSRLAELENELKNLPEAVAPSTARITFRGRPVVGSRGIFADFASKATSAFTEFVTVLAAAQSKPVAWTGPIPNRDESQILITGTAVGSFGFQIEEHMKQNVLPGVVTPVSHALEQCTEILSGVLGDDDEVAEVISGMDLRAISNLRNFLNVLANNEAVCRVSFKNHDCQFSDVAQVRAIIERISEDNLHETTERFFGRFLGVLPNRRRFEFFTEPEGELIVGKIGSEIAEPETINQHIDQPVELTLNAISLGHGRPKYVLQVAPKWS